MMIRMMMALCLILPAAASAQTRAQVEKARSPALEKCLRSGDAAQGVDPAMAACIFTEYGVQDDRLNRSYKSTMTRLSPAARQRLQRSERVWIGQRDAKCQAEGQRTGGSIDRINGAFCMLDETVRRRLWLARHR